MNLWIIFLTGLTTGSLSCLAMQGGLLASVIANQEDSDQPWIAVALFLLSKLVAHTILGFLLGWLGSQLELSLTVRLLFQGLAALFMLATAANLLNLHPIFRYVVVQPPKALSRIVRNSSKGKAGFAPAVLGFLTVFIPCGVTQAMEVLAITSGNPLLGAAIMFFFVLGTFPLFSLIGVATAKLSETFRVHFLRFAAVILIFLGLSSVNGVLVVLDAPVTWEKIVQPVSYFFSDERFASNRRSAVIVNEAGVQPVNIIATNDGYSPRSITVKAGIPVALTLATKDTYTCATSFVFKEFNIRMLLGPTDSQTVSFTPTETGKYTFTCSMGMYTGVMEVI
ncbi:MAG: sulfite exporter TauE/SafE family protein [bacterium]|nr:sulfite exporter TauE/SafE family protein [bacterium]